jgi:hypothetical protein
MASRFLPGTIVASAVFTASGDSGALHGWGDAKTLRLQLNVTAVAGTSPTLDVVVEDTLDGVNYNIIATFAQKTVAAREVLNVTTPFTNTIRVRWTIGGTTPSFTFEVDGFSA